MHELQKLEEELKALENQPKPEERPEPEVKEEDKPEEQAEQEPEVTEADNDESEDVGAEDESKEDPPHAEFIKNRQESKKKRLEEAEAKNRELELELARMQAKKEAEAEFAKKNEKPPEDTDPEPEEGTWEHSEWTQRQLKREIAALKMQMEAAAAEQQWLKIDKQWSDKNPNYKGATEYLRSRLKENVKAQFPHYNDAQVEENAKMREYKFIGGLARSQVDIETYMIAEAMKEGWTPSNAQAKPSLQRGDKPATDKREVSFQKRQAGSVIAAPAGKGSRGITIGDVKRMDRQELLAMTADDWKDQIEQAYNSDAR